MERTGTWLAIGMTALALLGCQSRPAAREVLRDVGKGLPGQSQLATVSELTARGSYLDVTLDSGGGYERLFFANEPACLAFLELGASVEYSRDGALGTVRGSEGSCPAIGIGSLEDWRTRHRARTMRGNPTAAARFQLIYEDEQVFIVRGRFPLTNRIGWTRGDDTAAVLPVNDACRAKVEKGNGTLEYHNSGPVAYEIRGPAGRCVLEGLLIPQ